MFICKHCGKECPNLNSLTQHEIRCKENPNRRAFNSLANYSSAHFKGQTKETNPIIAQQSATLKKMYEDGTLVSHTKGKPGTFKGKHHSEETKQRIGSGVSRSRKEGYASGKITPAKGVGRGKYSYIETSHKRYMLRSTYEFIFALYLLKVKNIDFEIEKIKVPAIRKNNYAETFLSDFSVNNTVIEIKGIPSGKDAYIKESFEAAGYKFIELFEQDILKIKQELISKGIDVDYLINQVIKGHKEKNYFTYKVI